MRNLVVMITGAARGLGAATAREVVARGGRVALVGLEPELLEALAAELGPGAFWCSADVRDRAQLDVAVEQALAVFGRLDVVVANAGIGRFASVAETSSELLRDTMDVNFWGTFHTIQATLPALLESRGYFLGVASGAAALPLPGFASYSSSKAAQEALLNVLRMENAHLGLAVGVGYFTFMDTDMVREGTTHPAFSLLQNSLPGPLRAIFPVSMGARALVRGMERRSARVVAPAALQPVLWLRHLLAARLATLARADSALVIPR